jgi:hypothetical protein
VLPPIDSRSSPRHPRITDDRQPQPCMAPRVNTRTAPKDRAQQSWMEQRKINPRELIDPKSLQPDSLPSCERRLLGGDSKGTTPSRAGLQCAAPYDACAGQSRGTGRDVGVAGECAARDQRFDHHLRCGRRELSGHRVAPGDRRIFPIPFRGSPQQTAQIGDELDQIRKRACSNRVRFLTSARSVHP